MSKRSGFAVKITAFIEANPKDMKAMLEAGHKVASVEVVMKQAGFLAVEADSRFMLSREVPDEPPPVPEPQQIFNALASGADMPPIPATLDRRKP